MAEIQVKENIGKIQNELHTGMKLSWVIRNYFSLPQNYDFGFCSPTFTFFNEKWLFVLSPSGLISDESFGWIRLGLLKVSSGTPIHNISCKLSIEKNDGAEYVSQCATQNFGKTKNLLFKSFLHRARLLEDKDEIMSNGNLTIHCILKAEDGKSGLSDAEDSGVIATSAVKETDCDLADKKDTSPNPTGVFKLAEDFKELLLNGTHFDTTIKISDREFPAHRAILSSRSPVFASMFRHDTTERNTGTIEIEDCDPGVFLEFLSFLYSGVLEDLSSENAVGLYTVADKYGVLEVKAQCLEFMKNNLSTDNFCDITALALRHSEFELLEKAKEYFVQNTREIAVTSKWLCFHKEYPVESNELYIKSLDFRERK